MADLVVEGEVIAQKAFEDAESGRIFTENTIKVYSVFKGTTNQSTIKLITYGGQMGDRLEVANPNLELRKAHVGVFLLEENAHFKAYSGVSGPSSFIAYDRISRKAVDAFETFPSDSDLKTDLESITGKHYSVSDKPEIYYQIAANKKAGISSFTKTVTAGNGFILEINGTGFGKDQAQVAFANGNDGGATTIVISDSAYFKSWSDTKIEISVPQLAGTGEFFVITSDNTTHASGTDLTVSYSRLEIVASGPSTNPGTRLYSPVLEDDNSEGGYTWRFHTDFKKNSAAMKSIMRALQSWRCSTGVNFGIDTTTAVTNNTVDRDGVHTIMWQNPSQLISTGALGVTFSLWSGCYNSSIKDWHWYLNDVDMVFDDELSNGRTWNYGPGSPTSAQYDMESVALHELGHAHQLGHIIDSDGIMHYSIRNGDEKRKLNTDIDIAAGDDVMKESTATTGCSSVDPMKKLTSNCAIIDVVDITADFLVDFTKVCVGDTITLTNKSEPLGANLTWRVPAEAKVLESLSSNNKKVVEITGAGNLNFGLLVEEKGFSDSLYQMVRSDILPVPLSKVDDVVCAGDANGKASLILGRGQAPFSIIWQDNGQTANPRNNLKPGVYYFECLDATSCAVYDSIVVTEPDSLLISNTGTEATWGGLARGKAFVEVMGGTLPYKYRWNDDANQKTDTAYGLLAGDYTVTITDANDCETNTTITVTELSSVENLNGESISVYPNPTKDLFVFEVSNAQEIKVMDFAGRVVLTKTLNASMSLHQIDINNLPKGVYSFVITTNAQLYKGLVIKEYKL